MDKKQKIIIIVFGVVVLLGIILGALIRDKDAVLPETGDVPGASNQAVSEKNKYFSDKVATNTVATKPNTSVPAAPNTNSQLGIYDMTVDKNGFHPDTLVVKLGDVVNIKLTALDGNYDFAIPMKGTYQIVKRGETVPINFGVTRTGTFDFVCQNLCPSGKVIKGQLVVKPE